MPSLREPDLDTGPQVRRAHRSHTCDQANAAAGIAVPIRHVLGRQCICRAKRNSGGAKRRNKFHAISSGRHAHRFSGLPNDAPLK
jgi:hypothetical protein